MREMFRRRRGAMARERDSPYGIEQSASLYADALALLRQSLDDPTAEFRDDQWEAIRELVMNRRRLLLVQRTGWGKSIVYFIATALLRRWGAGPTLLISPLLALMRNQIDAASRVGVKALTINSTNSSEWQQVEHLLAMDQVDILLISPERLANEAFRQTVLPQIAARIGMFVVDEAHCISDWGHDFRPDYRRIARILQLLPRNVPVLATTATANDRVVADIEAQLGPQLRTMRGPLYRQSLQLQVLEMPSQAARLAWLAEHVPHLSGSGIIYTLTIRDADNIATWLRSRGIDAQPYSGQMENPTREALERQLLDNRVKALVATVALGMGFDKPDLGFVIHFQRPGSVVHYYQQIGRAGRALEDAHVVLLYGAEDDEIIDYFIRTAFPPESHAQAVFDALSRAADGLNVRELEQRINASRSELNHVLKLLSLEDPAPIQLINRRWYANPIRYRFDAERVERITALRRDELQRMDAYVRADHCLMQFLLDELNDPQATPCGRCAVCTGSPPIPTTFSLELAQTALAFLRSSTIRIPPRRRWYFPKWTTIPEHLRAEEGRALCYWGDAGWGELVRTGKLNVGRFDDDLVEAIADMVGRRWRPSPTPSWVTCVPSRRHPELVVDFAERVAAQLGLPFVPCIRKVRETEPQKEMQNSYQQATNLVGVFEVDRARTQRGPVLLIDDMVDSRWTFTALAALLLRVGSGPVFPVALANSQAG